MDDWALDAVKTNPAIRDRVESLIRDALRAAYVVGNWDAGENADADEGTRVLLKTAMERYSN
jgi:hypothetical protein